MIPLEVLDAKQRLLPEIGEAGQAKLRATQATLPTALSPGARSTAALYLARAGVRIDREEDAALGGSASDALLDELRGCLQAVATIRAIVGVAGAPLDLEEASFPGPSVRAR